MRSRGQRRPASNTVDAALAAFDSVSQGLIEPPATVSLRDVDKALWREVMLLRARDEWSHADLHDAARLVRAYTDSERIERELQAEGDTLAYASGARYVNPKHQLLETLNKRIERLKRLLHLHAAALGKPHNTLGTREAEADAREISAEIEDDDLLARPGARLN